MRSTPVEDVLKPREKVLWARKKGISFWIPFFSILAVGIVIIYILDTSAFGAVLAVPLVILAIGGIFFIFLAFIRGRATKYYLTSERLIETRNGQIVHEVPLERFNGKPLSQFFEKRCTHLANNQPVYMIRIYDPLSGDALIEFKDLDGTSVRALEKIGQTVKCRYCGLKNPATSEQCKKCGSPLQ